MTGLPARRALAASLLLLPLALTSCDDASPGAFALLGGDATLTKGASKVEICHYEGNGDYHIISVSSNALDAHLTNHGDDLALTSWPDADGDGWGDGGAASEPCLFDGYVVNDGDCDDTDAALNEDDADSDGWSSCDGDCDDANAGVNPDAEEVCNDLDDDCDGTIDLGASDAGTWYRDGDEDGWGELTGLLACEAPEGYVGVGGDCDDDDATSFPGAVEVCDQADNDCDGDIDEDDVCCVEADFSLDFAESWNLTGLEHPSPTWTLSSDRLTVSQGVNSDPGVYMTNLPAYGFEITFQLRVTSTSDDDFIGWVVGFEAGDSTSPGDWMLFDWKQGWQNLGGLIATPGMAMSHVTGVPNHVSELWTHSGDVSEVARALTLGNQGWQDLRTYTVRMAYSATHVQVWVDGVLQFDEVGDFPLGNFGFYTFSQQNGRFTLVSPTGTTCY